MTANARNEILSRLRDRPRDAGAPPASDFGVLSDRDWSTDEKIERLTGQLEAVNAEVHRVAAAELGRSVADRLRAAGARTLLFGENSDYLRDIDGALPETIKPLVYDRDIEDWRRQLFDEVDAALTSTRGAIAETGSLILWPTASEPRLMSLVPPIHIAVVPVRQLYSTFWQAMTEQDWASGMPTNALLVSGPSKTADIEQTLVYGAHGPRELIVYLIE